MNNSRENKPFVLDLSSIWLHRLIDAVMNTNRIVAFNQRPSIFLIKS